jgi:hypothetical protein
MGHFDDDHTRRGAPLFPSERKNGDGRCRRVGDDALGAGLAEAAAKHLPDWGDTLTPHVLGHYAASQLYHSGLDLISIQETLGHAAGVAGLRVLVRGVSYGLGPNTPLGPTPRGRPPGGGAKGGPPDGWGIGPSAGGRIGWATAPTHRTASQTVPRPDSNAT